MYRENENALKVRISELQNAAESVPEEMDRFMLEERIKLLETMRREARELAVLTARYYERGYYRSEKYTTNGLVASRFS